MVNKTKRGDNIEVRPCLRCNVCTSKHTSKNLPIRCAINPILGRETDYATIEPAKEKKKVVVVGGGPGGMQAALTASCRGHEVVLLEKGDKLGGNLTIAAGPSFKEDMKRYLEWLTRQVQKDPNMSIKLRSEATADLIKAEDPDAIIVAVGADPLLPAALIGDRKNVVWAGDVHVDKALVGDTVVVAGGGLTGCEAALHLAQSGKKVTVIDMLDIKEISLDVPRALLTMLGEKGVRMMMEVKLEEITDDGVTVIDKAWNRTAIPADTVVMSLGFKRRSGIVEAFSDIIPDVYFAGDCRKPKDLKQAIHDAFNIAVEI